MEGVETEESLACIDILLAYGACIECDSEAHSAYVAPPLFLAAQDGLIGTVKRLLKAGADCTRVTTVKDEQRWTASDVAWAHRDRDPERYDQVIKLLDGTENFKDEGLQAAL